jgi:hypothetical protein
MYKQPSYVAARCNKELLRGHYRGFEYRIMDLGTHPTAYVKIPEGHPFWMDWRHPIADKIEVHGGITYSRKGLYCESNYLDGWWIGWDYAHWGDHSGYDGAEPWNPWIKKWTTEEILHDVTSVIDQCVEATK